MADDRTSGGADIDRPISCHFAASVAVSSAGDGFTTRYFLKTANGDVFVFGEQEHFLWTSLDGRASFATIEQDFRNRFGVRIRLSDLTGFIAHGLNCGLIERYGEASDTNYDIDPTKASTSSTDHEATHGLQQRRGRQHVTLFGKEPWTVIIGNPTRLFSFLGRRFGFLARIKWFVFPAALFGAMILIKHLPQFAGDWRKVTSSIPWWPFMYSFEHSLNLLARVTEGTIIQANGGVIEYYGVRFLFGFVMRGFIDEEDSRKMPERIRLWSKAGVLLIRLALFSITAFLWITLRPTHPVLAQAALFVSVLSFILFCVNACPLIPAEGYELMSAFLHQNKLALRAFRFMGFRLSGGDTPEAMLARESTGLTLYAIATFVALTYIFGSLMMDLGNFVTQTFDGFGYLIITAVVIASCTYIYQMTRFNMQGNAKKGAISRALARRRSQSRPAESPVA